MDFAETDLAGIIQLEICLESMSWISDMADIESEPICPNVMTDLNIE